MAFDKHKKFIQDTSDFIMAGGESRSKKKKITSRKADAELIRLHKAGAAIPSGMGGRLAELIADQGKTIRRDKKGNIVKTKGKK